MTRNQDFAYIGGYASYLPGGLANKAVIFKLDGGFGWDISIANEFFYDVTNGPGTNY